MPEKTSTTPDGTGPVLLAWANKFLLLLSNTLNSNGVFGAPHILILLLSPLNGTFKIQVSEECFFIHNPIAFNESYLPIPYKTEHTLKDNGNNSYTYTKYIAINNSLDINNAKYLDTALYVSEAEDNGIVAVAAFSMASMNGRNNSGGSFTNEVITDADFNTDGPAPVLKVDGTSISTGVDAMQVIAGNNNNTTSTTSQGSGTTFTFRQRGIQSHYVFDSSGVTAASALSVSELPPQVNAAPAVPRSLVT